ncbi:hypothetical protein MBRA1_002485 [Malassezia brasiliensis]|uniref:Uncharacterized protein n=1 Tax=Malassezia brasiliensis TaxID=1821822 RepID=A0AAF0DW00_9BASI|nr:hypothetical protein MBRA1_002485 [Malassezia brasiliensis]
MSGAIPHEELPILEALINIRNQLTALKKDSAEYTKPQEVQSIYNAVIKQITKLNKIREEQQVSEAVQDAGKDGSGNAKGEMSDYNGPLTKNTRVDTMLVDVFYLLSLFFITVGRSRECPAMFSQIGCMKQLLDHMDESGVYTEADLKPFASRIQELDEIIKRDEQEHKHPPQLTKLMKRKLDVCQQMVNNLENKLSVLSVELLPIHQKLVSIRRQLFAAAAKRKPAKADVKQLQEELRKIEAKRVDGKFLGPGGSSVPEGQEILAGLLESCFETSNDILVRNTTVSPTLQPIYDRLMETKQQLEHLEQRHRWTLRETDLWTYHLTLKDIDRLRVNGKFVDNEGRQPEGQLVLLYLLRRCYNLLNKLISSSEPLSEELMPISNKLSTISKCLKEVSKYGGTFTLRDMYPYRLALHQIASMRKPVLDKQGNPTDELQWLDRNGSVPEGQTILQAQFEEVEQTIEELLNREEAEDDDDDDDYDNADGSVSSSVTTEEGTASESDLVVSTVLDSQSAISTPDVEVATSQLAIA